MRSTREGLEHGERFLERNREPIVVRLSLGEWGLARPVSPAAQQFQESVDRTADGDFAGLFRTLADIAIVRFGYSRTNEEVPFEFPPEHAAFASDQSLQKTLAGKKDLVVTLTPP